MLEQQFPTFGKPNYWALRAFFLPFCIVCGTLAALSYLSVPFISAGMKELSLAFYLYFVIYSGVVTQVLGFQGRSPDFLFMMEGAFAFGCMAGSLSLFLSILKRVIKKLVKLILPIFMIGTAAFGHDVLVHQKITEKAVSSSTQMQAYFLDNNIPLSQLFWIPRPRFETHGIGHFCFRATQQLPTPFNSAASEPTDSPAALVPTAILK